MTRPIWIDIGLAKAAPTPGHEWLLYIQASTPALDYQGEQVLQSALQDACAYFLANGKLTYEHVTIANRHDPSNFIGEPLDVRFPPDGRTLIKGWLYQQMPKAQAVWGILQSGGRIKASIGGAVLDGENGIIRKVFWNHVALTPWPVNDETGVTLTPMAEFLKALGALAGTSAQPLVMQDLEGAQERLTPAFRQRWQALTEIIARTQRKSQDEARRIALALLIRRGEARGAFAAGGKPHGLT